ncbi:MAG: thiol reductant ABC exporter subunit CydC [Wenzhouxiangellaceae bacterium]|nr:thiol reductant ABC exporter subunit CydC [Wenzhouxiangellaceae bacterium]
MRRWVSLLLPEPGQRRWLLLALLLASIAAVAAAGLLALSGWFITATGLAGLGLLASLDIFAPGAGIRAFAVGRTVARYLERLIGHEATFAQLAALRVRLFSSLLGFDVMALQKMRRGDTLARLTGDVDTLDHFFLRLASPTIATLALTALVAAGLYWLAPGLGMIVAVMLLVLGPLQLLALQAACRRPGVSLAHAAVEQSTGLAETLSGMAEIKALGQARQQVEQASRSARLRLGFEFGLRLRESLARFGLALVGNLSIWLVLGLGLMLFEAAELTAPQVILASLAVVAVAEAWPGLAAGWSFFETSRQAGKRVLALERNSQAAIYGRMRTSFDQPIIMDRVSFRYSPAADPVLDDLSLVIEPGEHLLVEGPSGCGKSTLGMLLARMAQPSAGSIRIGAVDYQQVEPACFRKQLGYLAQQPVLFQDTLGHNLRLARPDADDSLLQATLESLELGDFLRRLPDGLDSWLGEAGHTVSGGEARRLALARLILGDFRVLVLDEPTAGVDLATSLKIAARLEPWLAGRTVIMLSHDPKSLPGFSRRIVLEPWAAGREFTPRAEVRPCP